MRHSYQLTDETFLVLSRHESKIASEYDCNASYIFAIKNQDSKDPFAPFKRLFKASARAGAPVQIWLNELMGVYVNSKPIQDCMGFSKQIIKKIRTDSECTEKMIRAIEDGELDKRECHELLAINARVRENADHLEIVLQKRLGEIDKKDTKEAAKQD